MRTNYDVAIRMENKKIADGVVIFKPTNAIAGEYDSFENIFRSFDGESYYSEKSFIGNFDMTEDYLCSSIISKKEFNEKYGHFKTFKEALRQYKEDYGTYYKLLYFDQEEQEFKWINFNIESLFEMLTSKREQIDDELPALFEEKQIYTMDDKDTYEEVLRGYIDKVKSIYSSNKSDKEFLKAFSEVLDFMLEDLVSIMYDISNEFQEQAPKNPNSEGKKSTTTEQKNKYEPESINLEEKIKFYEKRKKIIESVKKVIIGHDEEVEKMVIEIFRNIRQYGTKNKGILLTGSTGTGKSKICELIGENLGRTCKIVDTTQLSAPGYKGRDIESYLEEIYDSTGGNLKKAEESIIVFDEVDKLGHSKRDDDVSGIQVLNRLLMFLNGTTYTIKNNAKEKVDMSTKNMIVVFCGSFSSVYKTLKLQREKKALGFGAKNEKKEQKITPTIEDFIKYGGMPDEMMGRFPVAIHLEDLTRDNLKDILLKSSESPILFAKAEFMGEAGVELIFTEEAVEKIADMSYNLRTGARSLNSIISNCIDKAFETVTNNIGVYDQVTITAETVDDNSKFLLHEVVDEDVKQKIKR